MYAMLVKLIVGASLLQLGLNLKNSGDCSSRECLARVERASRQVLKIDWKPISVFPGEASKFSSSNGTRPALPTTHVRK